MAELDRHASPVLVAIIAAIADGCEDPDAERRSLADGLGELNRALGTAVPLGDADRIATHVPLASAFAADGSGMRGLVHAPSDVVRTLIAIDDTLADVSLRIGIGVGELDGPLGPPATALQGPCLRAAAGALAAATKRRRWARVSGLGESGDRVINGMLALFGALRSEWTMKQARTVRLARRHETRKAVAQELRVSPSVVTEALAAAHFGPLEEAEAALNALFTLFDPPR